MEVYCDLVVVDLYSGFAIENLRCAFDLLYMFIKICMVVWQSTQFHVECMLLHLR
jgi:hypothetical protein